VLNLDGLIDFANAATADIAKYQVSVVLNADNILAGGQSSVNALNWQSVSYGEAEIDRVPDDKRGIYAFAVCVPSSILPPHGYILYIGIAGRDSARSLRARYKDYLNMRRVIKRDRIARMIGTWHQVLRFFFAPVGEGVSSDDLQRLERQLNTAFMPPFSEGDLEAETKRKRRAFR
jgi:hypothetical protein